MKAVRMIRKTVTVLGGGGGGSGGGSRSNEILCVPCSASTSPSSLLIYFPGDIQTWKQEMKKSNWCELAEQFSLESTAALLSERFTNSNVVVISPARFTSAGFSEYDNLLNAGNSIVHLSRLVHEAEDTMDAVRNEKSKGLPIALLAFSKGALVINSIFAEYASLVDRPLRIYDWEDVTSIPGKHIPENENTVWRDNCNRQYASVLDEHTDEIINFYCRIVAGHWIDCHRFPTNPIVINKIAASVFIGLHGTKRQLNKKARPWIFQEHSYFANELTKANAKLFSKMYLEDLPPSLLQHFSILKEFKLGL